MADTTGGGVVVFADVGALLLLPLLPLLPWSVLDSDDDDDDDDVDDADDGNNRCSGHPSSTAVRFAHRNSSKSRYTSQSTPTPRARAAHCSNCSTWVWVAII
jgi:hypothetical protein